MCFSLHIAILTEVFNKGIQLWHILLKMCICGVKNIIFKLKLLKNLKYRQITNTYHVSIFHFMWVSISHCKHIYEYIIFILGEVIPVMLVHDYTMADNQALSHQQWHIYTWHAKYLYEKYLLLVYIINICKNFLWKHSIFDSMYTHL